MISTLVSMATVPSRVWNMFETKTYGNKAGIYSLKMYNLGVPISIVVDDFVPYNSSWGENQYMDASAAKELWPVFAEKAFSKLMGSYGTI